MLLALLSLTGLDGTLGTKFMVHPGRLIMDNDAVAGLPPSYPSPGTGR